MLPADPTRPTRNDDLSLTGFVFLGAYATGLWLAFARHPIFGLMTYVAVFYLHPPSRWWGATLPDLRWSLLAAFVTLIALTARKRLASGDTPLFAHGVMMGFLLFLGWIAIQWGWALDATSHTDLVVIYAKYALLIGLVNKCIESAEHLRLFLWTHVLGCAYLGWIVFTSYEGGRFEGFGGPDINEANAGALQVVTGIFTASALFLAGQWRERAALLGVIPFIVNALVATVSRSGFLAAAFGGVVFNLFTPARFRVRVIVLSMLALVLFALLTNPTYWLRIASLGHAGEEVEGVDTGAGRIVLIEAQWRMFQGRPLGCGHRCTAVLSPSYLDERDLTTSAEGVRARSSHNTAMSLLVEQGIPGIMFYAALLVWVARSVVVLARRLRGKSDFISSAFPAVAASMAAITLGDMFVDYLKAEVRIWFVALLMVMLKLSANRDHENAGGGA